MADDRRWLLAVLLGGQVMANIDTAIVNIAVPSIRAGFDASQGQSALVVSGYLVAYAVLLVTGARLGATHGYRRMFLGGLAAFLVASLACGLAPGIGWLVVARFAQGAAAAVLVPQVLSGIQLHFAGPARMRALGWYAMALSGGAVAGQVLGGLLVSANLFGTGWRSIFLINVPVGLVLLLAAPRVLPHDGAREPSGLDLRGVATLSVSVLLVIIPLALGRELGWPPWTWWCLAASGPAFLVFVRTERRIAARGGRPLLAPAVLRGPAVRSGLIAHGLTAATYFGLLFVLSLYLQQGLGVSAAQAGLAMVSWVAAFGLAGLALPRLPARYLPVAPMAGCLILAAGYASVCVFLLAGGRTGPGLFVLLGVGGFGLGLGANALIGAMTSASPDRYAADLSGVISTNVQLSGACGVAAASTGYLSGLDTTAAVTVVLAGFTVLALLASVPARTATA